jgi:hypothetical protein
VLKWGLFFLCFLYWTSTQAGNGRDSVPAFRNIYKLDISRALQGTLQLSRESALRNSWTFQGAVMGTYAASTGLAKIYLQSQSFSYKDISTLKTYSLSDITLLGYGLNFQLKKYLGKAPKPPFGFYLGPEFFLRQLFLQSTIENSISKQPQDISKNLMLGYLGYIVGYQRLVQNIVCIDTYVGGGFFYSRYVNENTTTHYLANYQLDYTGFYFNAGLLIGLRH